MQFKECKILKCLKVETINMLKYSNRCQWMQWLIILMFDNHHDIEVNFQIAIT